jgi:hypothetical protein
MKAQDRGLFLVRNRPLYSFAIFVSSGSHGKLVSWIDDKLLF